MVIRLRQVDLYLVDKASLVYRVSSRTARATQRNPILKNQTTKAKHHILRRDRSRTFN